MISRILKNSLEDSLINVITSVQNLSSEWLSEGGSNVSELSGNWQNTFTTVQTNSAAWIEESNEYLPLSGGNLTGQLTTTSTISSSQTIFASGARVITGLPTDTIPVFFVTVLPQSAYDALGTKDPNTLYFIL